MNKFFNTRNRKISDLHLLADNLGYTLREGVSLFSINDSKNEATFITESGSIIEGNYYLGENLIFDNITVEDGETYSDEKKFDSKTKDQISSLIGSIYEDDLAEGSRTFDSIIESWGERIRFNEVLENLKEKKESFNNTFNIVETKEFSRFLELSENISKFLTENADTIRSIPEVKNAVLLSNTVANAFDLPRKSTDELVQEGRVEFALNENRDVYEMVCRQELLRKEILESKKSFDTVWVTEPVISNLTSKIFSDEDDVRQALVECFVEIPYIARISKKQLSNTISKNLETLNEGVSYTKGDLKEFTKTLFEMKKPLKQMVSSMLQEKYGINLNNIKETPTFKTLLNTQVLIFESLSKLSPRGSAIKETLHEMSEMLKGKNGVEAIDINNGLRFLFESSNLQDLYSEEEIVSSFSLNESVSEDLSETVELILSNIYEAEHKGEKKEEEEEEEEEEKKPKNKKKSDEKEEVSEGEESGLTTKELMSQLSDLEDLISGPSDIQSDN